MAAKVEFYNITFMFQDEAQLNEFVLWFHRMGEQFFLEHMQMRDTESNGFTYYPNFNLFIQNRLNDEQ